MKSHLSKGKRIICVIVFLALLLGGYTWGGTTAAAQNLPRTTTILVPYTQYEWWLLSWEDSQILCRIFIDHEGLPTAEEVAEDCGNALAEIWVKTPDCNSAQASNCDGVYVHLVSIQPAQKEVVVELPEPVVWVTLEGCIPIPPENLCPTIPTLLLTAVEPLPNETIESIQGLYDGIPFYCQSSVCQLPLRPTPLFGVMIEFWANSSYGDSSEHYFAQVRILDTGVSTIPGGSGWYVDIISSQWQGPPIASCARTWETFPPVGGTPTWLASPEYGELIASDNPYFYLAGRLITKGQVDARNCPSGGLLPNGYANSCGIEKARPLLEEWQNQFDQRIVNVSRETGVPAQLLKNLFAQESQFWPGVFRVRYEFGLGQLTDKGTDSIFLWNQDFYNQFCPLVLSEETCQSGYLHLKTEEKELLRGALASQAAVDCQDCPIGIDLTKTYKSVDLFAQTLVANCSQVDQTIYTATRLKSGQVSSYEDLWRFTIANYHAGPGCLAFAIHAAWQGIVPLSWDAVKANFTPACQGVIPYVDKITESK
jgi:hypothetical protein